MQECINSSDSKTAITSTREHHRSNGIKQCNATHVGEESALYRIERSSRDGQPRTQYITFVIAQKEKKKGGALKSRLNAHNDNNNKPFEYFQGRFKTNTRFFYSNL